MGLFGKRKKNDADKLESKRKGAFNVLNSKDSSVFAKTMAVFQIAVFSIGMLVLPIVVPIIMTFVAFFLLMIGAVGLLFYFDKEEEKNDAMQIDWSKYNCTCQFLTEEELEKFKEGGFDALGIDISASALNVTGDSLITSGDGSGSSSASSGGSSADGFIYAKENGTKTQDLAFRNFTVEIYDGYSKPCSDSDIIVNWAGDMRKNPFYAAKSPGSYEAEPESTSYYAKNGYISSGGQQSSIDKHVLQFEAKKHRLPVALGSGTLAQAKDDGLNYYENGKDWSAGGKDVDIVLGDGTVLPATLTDAKADMHTGGLTSMSPLEGYKKEQGVYWKRLDNALYITMQGGYDNAGNHPWCPADHSIVEAYYGSGGYESQQQILKEFVKAHNGFSSLRIYNSYVPVTDAKNNNPNAMSPSEAKQLVQSGGSGSGTVTTADLGVSSTLSGWTAVISNAECYLGYNGVNANRAEGDGTTPVGIWKMNTPFGIADKESNFPSNYKKVTSADWWASNNSGLTTGSGAENVGNPGSYGEVYEYVIDMGYNRSPYVNKKGSALFLHTKGSNHCTSGCVALNDNDMKTVMTLYEEGKAYIAVAQRGGFESIYGALGTNLSPSNYTVRESTEVQTFDVSKFKLPSDATLLVVIQADKGHDGTKTSSDKPNTSVTGRYWVYKRAGGNANTGAKSSSTTSSSTTSSSTTSSSNGFLGKVGNNLQEKVAESTNKKASTKLSSANSNSTSETVNEVATNGTGGGTAFPKYSLNDTQLRRVTRLCLAEQSDPIGVRIEASQIANRYDLYGSGAFDEWVDNARWWNFTSAFSGGTISIMDATSGTVRGNRGATRSAVPDSSLTPEMLEAVKDVIVNGNRVLPNYVDEHDCWSDIERIKVDGVAVSKDSDSNSVMNEKVLSWWSEGKKVEVSNQKSGSDWYTLVAISSSNKGIDPFGTIESTRSKLEKESKIIYGVKYPGIQYESGTQFSTGSSGSGTESLTSSDSLVYSDGQKIYLDESWEFYDAAKIKDGYAVYHRATNNRKNICIAIGAGHGTSGWQGEAMQIQCHPDGTPKLTGGSTAKGATKTTPINSGTDMAGAAGSEFSKGTAEAVVTLAMAKIFKKLCLDAGYDVLMLRDDGNDDVRLDNIARTVASNNVADCFIALHVNSDSGLQLFTMPPYDGGNYKSMYPVSEHYDESWALSHAIVDGWKKLGYNPRPANGELPTDLTQTSYSKIPTLDIEVVGREEAYKTDDITKRLQGILEGINTFYQSHQPRNQSKRGKAELGLSGSGNSEEATASTVSGGNSTGVNSVYSWIAINDPSKLRTSCAIMKENFCGCFMPDYNCMCHIFGGVDGILGTKDDGKAFDGTLYSSVANLGTEVKYVQDERVAKAVEWAKATAADNTHEYRLGASHPDEEQHYDCSSFVSHAYRHAGFDNLQVGCCYDKTLIANFKAAGFKWVEGEPKVEDLLPGDVVVNDSHTEMYIGNNMLVGAHQSPNTVKAENKNTTPESSISEIAYHDGWNGYLRYPLVAVQGGNGVSIAGKYSEGLEGLTASQAAPIIVARILLDTAMKNVAEKYPDAIDKAKSGSGNPLYSSQNNGGYAYDGGTVTGEINGKSVTFRNDCSGFMVTVMQQLGAPVELTNTSGMAGWSQTQISSLFQKLPFSWEALQPGDIIVTPGKGHTEMVFSYSNNVYRPMSWGSTGGVKNMYDLDTMTVRTVPIENPNRRNYGWIFRYTGSGEGVIDSLVSGTATSTAELGVSTARDSLANGSSISLNPSWKYASESKTNSGHATLYKAESNRKNKCVTVNAGHGSATAAQSKNKTFSNPEHLGKLVDGDTNSGAMSYGASSGMSFSDMPEAQAALYIAMELKTLLLDRGYDVLMIRETGTADCMMDNICRTVISNNTSDIHIAIHYDSSSSNAPAYYILSPENCTYGESQKWYAEDKKLGEALLQGLREEKNSSGNSVRATRSPNNWHVNDLTQNVYSTQPSIDIEMGDHNTPHDAVVAKDYARGLARGVDIYFGN